MLDLDQQHCWIRICNTAGSGSATLLDPDQQHCWIRICNTAGSGSATLLDLDLQHCWIRICNTAGSGSATLLDPDLQHCWIRIYNTAGSGSETLLDPDQQHWGIRIRNTAGQFRFFYQYQYLVQSDFQYSLQFSLMSEIYMLAPTLVLRQHGVGVRHIGVTNIFAYYIHIYNRLYIKIHMQNTKYCRF